MNELPSKVQEQDAAADKALEELINARSEAGTPGPEPAVSTPTNTPDPFADGVEPTGTPPAEAKTGEEGTGTRDELAKLNARFNVLRGKYDSEIPRFSARIRELEAQNEALKDELDAAREANEEADPSKYLKYLTEEERAELDPVVLDFQSRLAKGVAEAASGRSTSDLKKQVDSLQGIIDNLRQAQAVANDQAFWSRAEALAPGLLEANSNDDPDWLAFLDSVEPVSKATFRALGEAAVSRGDHEAVANLYNLFRGQAAPGAPRRTAESQLKPDTAPSAARTASRPQGRMIKESEIRHFYQTAAGRLGDAEIAAKEAEFDLAASEGRVLFGK